jgi:hypothetical protein
MQTHYTHTSLLLQPFPSDQQPVENCSISCQHCLNSAKAGLHSVFDIPLQLLIDTPLHEPGSLIDLYRWDDFSFQQLQSVMRLVRQQMQDEEHMPAMAR